MKHFRPILFAVLAALPACLCRAEETSLTPAALVRDNNAFALDLFQRLAGAPGDNVFFSPYSISTALAMTRAGTRGQTETQLASALHLSGVPREAAASAFGELQKSLNGIETQGNITLDIANSLWAQQDHAFLPEYLQAVREDFASAIFPVDFITHPDDARERVNAWVADRTNQRIKDLLQPSDVTPSTRLILVNAIYFKGSWEEAFDPKETASAPFTLPNGSTKPAMFMGHEMTVRYADLPDAPVPLQIAALPYKGGALEFDILLPRTADGLPALEKSLTAGLLDTWLSALAERRSVTVSLPKFKLTQRYPLGRALQALGVTDAFDPRLADFSGMDGARDLFVSTVIHQAYLDVNEEGTEAAAATAVGMTASAVQVPLTIRADHPFLFLIRDPASGSILFMGRFATPPDPAN
jgi:serine protease inhibitor